MTLREIINNRLLLEDIFQSKGPRKVGEYIIYSPSNFFKKVGLNVSVAGNRKIAISDSEDNFFDFVNKKFVSLNEIKNKEYDEIRKKYMKQPGSYKVSNITLEEINRLLNSEAKAFEAMTNDDIEYNYEIIIKKVKEVFDVDINKENFKKDGNEYILSFKNKNGEELQFKGRFGKKTNKTTNNYLISKIKTKKSTKKIEKDANTDVKNRIENLSGKKYKDELNNFNLNNAVHIFLQQGMIRLNKDSAIKLFKSGRSKKNEDVSDLSNGADELIYIPGGKIIYIERKAGTSEGVGIEAFEKRIYLGIKKLLDRTNKNGNDFGLGVLSGTNVNLIGKSNYIKRANNGTLVLNKDFYKNIKIFTEMPVIISQEELEQYVLLKIINQIELYDFTEKTKKQNIIKYAEELIKSKNNIMTEENIINSKALFIKYVESLISLKTVLKYLNNQFLIQKTNNLLNNLLGILEVNNQQQQYQYKLAASVETKYFNY